MFVDFFNRKEYKGKKHKEHKENDYVETPKLGVSTLRLMDLVSLGLLIYYFCIIKFLILKMNPARPYFTSPLAAKESPASTSE